MLLYEGVIILDDAVDMDGSGPNIDLEVTSGPNIDLEVTSGPVQRDRPPLSTGEVKEVTLVSGGGEGTGPGAGARGGGLGTDWSTLRAWSR